MPPAAVKFKNVTFRYPSSGSALFTGLTLNLPAGWTGIVGASGTGKTTILRLATGFLTPQGGAVDAPGEGIYCQQRTGDCPSGLQAFLDASDGIACRLKGRLGIAADWGGRWETLSHGERKRVQIAVAIWREPRLLAVDEPTNHLDGDSRRLLQESMDTYRGVGLLVSHDRQLLDALCRQCLFVEPPDIVLRPGGVSQGQRQAREEDRSRRKQLLQARREYAKVEREASRRRHEAARAQKLRSKRGLDPKDHDGRFKINQARVSGKDAVAGKLLRQLDGRLEQARKRQDDLVVKGKSRLGIGIPGTRSRRDQLIRLPAGKIALGQRQLVHPELVIRPQDRIALTGPNGAGKSSLVRQLVRSLSIPTEAITYLPQELETEAGREMLREIDSLPGDRLGEVMSVFSRLGSEPHRLLESEEPSPGEARKLMLALGISNSPWIIIMDEPTNHLDLPSVECLEKALGECPSALLLVSHDERFLRALTATRWLLKRRADDQDSILEIEEE